MARIKDLHMRIFLIDTFGYLSVNPEEFEWIDNILYWFKLDRKLF